MTSFVAARRNVLESSIRADGTSDVLRAAESVGAAAFSTLRQRTVLDGCKWDPQIGDIDILSPFPLILNANVWEQIASLAERLTEEAIAAELEISQRPELLSELGLPAALRRVLAQKAPFTPAAGRVMRFDFHPTTQGWRISEANSDVPGGFSESSHFTALMAEHFPQLQTTGNPAARWSDALADSAGPSGTIAFLSAPGHMEDHEVIAFLAASLRERGCRPHLAKPEQIVWRDGFAFLNTKWHSGPLDTIVRFYQAEWLARLPRRFAWGHFFRGGRTPVANPALAVISESKRFPLLWERLSTPLPTWQVLLPETRDTRDAPWSYDDGWLLKAAICNTGEAICMRELMSGREWLRTRIAVQARPSNWVAQRRFESVPVATPVGLRHACVGVYTVNGRAAGAYTRISSKSLIDFTANDVALLISHGE